MKARRKNTEHSTYTFDFMNTSPVTYWDQFKYEQKK